MRDRARYEATEKAKERKRRYDATEKGRERKRRYAESARGREVKADNNSRRLYAGNAYMGVIGFSQEEREGLLHGKAD